jgi:predicted AlkP superfamily pyrophosphatase or phosphodiesterase
MKKLYLLLAHLILLFPAFAQSQSPEKPKRPKLVVGLVIDQMRWDFLYRYADRYGTGGFNRLQEKGFSCENTYIPYTPTYTAAGHASIYTGSVPAVNGIIGNNWYSRQKNSSVYCTDDDGVQTVGSNSKAGLMSPKNLWTSTVTDELRLATNFKSKVVGVALKDRGAILPAGHAADAAYWFDNATGSWITSTHYMKELPQWVKALNDKRLPDKYMAANWNTLYPINTYTQSTADKQDYENELGGSNGFPHQTSTIGRDNKYEAFRTTPSANTYTFDMAKAAIEGEKLGQRGNTDFLALSFSSPDYIGHAFGPNSIEAEDCYLRLDRDLASFLTYLDTKIGKGEYLVFLSADHGVAHVPEFLKEHKIPGGTVSESGLKTELNNLTEKKFGVKDLITTIINYQVYLNLTLLKEKELDREKVIAFLQEQLMKNPAIASTVDLEELGESNLQATLKERLTNGYNAELSGDLQYIFKPQWFHGGSKGTTHGLWNPYDSHIPLLFYGWGIKPGRTYREVYMTDIAPTIAALLKIQEPNGNVGKVIGEVLVK